MTNTTTRRREAAIYARLSVATEESVSVERQVSAARKYAEARDLDVVLVAVDDGVSATKHRPEARDGWREVLDFPGEYDVVVVWKVDRLCRRVLDFLHAERALQSRGAGLVAVEDPIDMTTAQGRAFATMLAVFGEMEAAAISARVKAARRHLTASGRISAGDVPWPFEKVPNPDGAGWVARPMPERAEAVREAAEWLLSGVSLSEVARRWTAAGLPTAGKGRKDRGAPLASWSRTSVKNVMTNPALYGATRVGDDVLRHADRSVVIEPARVILDRGTFERVRSALTSAPRGRRPSNLPLLHGIAWCASCGGRLDAHRPSDPSRPATMRCQNRECPARVSVGMALLEEHLVQRFLALFGTRPATVEVTESQAADPDAIAALEADLLDVSEALEATDDDDEVLALVHRRKALRADLAALQDAPAETVTRRVPTGRTVAEEWSTTYDVAARRDHLRAFLAEVYVSPGTRGRKGLDASRVNIRPQNDEADLADDYGDGESTGPSH